MSKLLVCNALHVRATPCGAVQVYSACFYMGLFGGKTAKPHKLWSNDPGLLGHVVRGAHYMPKTIRETLTGKPLVRKYQDKNGVQRHAGIRDRLKASQRLG